MANPIEEFSTPSPNSNPFSITAGSDGNLWFTEVSSNKIGRLTPGGRTAEFAVPAGGSPGGIAPGPDGALWFTEIAGDRIGRITTDGAITEFAIPSAGAAAHRITAGPDGALWFAEAGTDKIGRITLSGSITEFSLPTAGSAPFDITTGPDGALWFTEIGGNRIGRITTGGAITEFNVITASSSPAFIAAGPDGALWFTEVAGAKIGHVTTAGVLDERVTLPGGTSPQGIVAGPDGNMWFTESGTSRVALTTIAGALTEFALPTGNSSPFDIVSGPQGNLWFTEFAGNKIGEIAPAPPLSFDQSWNFAATADFNGDGRPDLAFQRQSDGAIGIQFASGVTAIGQATVASNVFGPSWSVAVAGDFNGDGTADLVFRRPSDGLTEIQLLNANTAVGGGAIQNNPFDSAWNIAATADFSGDGKSDLVWQRLSDGLVEVQFLNGIQPVGGGLILNSPFDNSWQVAGAGDFSGDGRADLVYRRPSDGLTELQFLNGTQPVGGGAIANNPFDNSWQIAGIGDFNGDGRADLVYRRSDGLTEIQFLNGANAVGGGVIAGNPFDSSWQIVGTGDFNGDGSADLVYHRASDGLTEVELLRGTTMIGGGPLA